MFFFISLMQSRMPITAKIDEAMDDLPEYRSGEAEELDSSDDSNSDEDHDVSSSKKISTIEQKVGVGVGCVTVLVKCEPGWFVFVGEV